MRPSLRQVFAQLASEGLIAAEDEKRFREILHQKVQQELPWYLKALMGAGAWVATGLFLLFLMIAGVLDSEAVVLILGLLMVGAGVVLKLRAEAPVLTQLALATSFVGQVMAVAGMGALSNEDLAAAALGTLLSVVLIRVFKDPVHRFVSTLGAVLGIVYLFVRVDEQILPEVAFVLLLAATIAFWQRPPALTGVEAELQGPVGHGLAISLLAACVPFSMGWDEASRHVLTGSVALTLGVLFLEARLLGLPGRKPDAVAAAILGATLLVAVATFGVPGIQAALVLMLIAINRRDPLLLGEAIIGFVYFLGYYYYSLELTLLHKSAALIVSGGVLLAVWRLLSHPRVVAQVAR